MMDIEDFACEILDVEMTPEQARWVSVREPVLPLIRNSEAVANRAIARYLAAASPETVDPLLKIDPEPIIATSFDSGRLVLRRNPAPEWPSLPAVPLLSDDEPPKPGA